jgi:hypothetical protein
MNSVLKMGDRRRARSALICPSVVLAPSPSPFSTAVKVGVEVPFSYLSDPLASNGPNQIISVLLYFYHRLSLPVEIRRPLELKELKKAGKP